MQPWFVWNDRNSYAEGLWINKLPKIGHGQERIQEIVIPGRAGSLTMLEGEDVYEGYVREITVITRNDNARIQNILDWLRGSGELITSNESDKIYDARISGEVFFERISNDLCQAKIPFYCEPFKRSRNPERIEQTANSGTIFNMGNVATKPIVYLECAEESITVGINGDEMTFANLYGTIKIDCDAKVVLKDAEQYHSGDYYYKGDYCTDSGKLYTFTASGYGSALVTNGKREEVSAWDDSVPFTYVWPGTYSGTFWHLAKGRSTITKNKTATIYIDPQWRWV